MKANSLQEFEKIKQLLADQLSDLANVVEAFDEIQGESINVDLDNDITSSRTLKDIILEQRQRMLDGVFKIMVLGEFNTGKSTFLNALMQEKVLPVAVRPTTATINRIRYAPEKKIEVHFWGERDEFGKEISPGKSMEVSINRLAEYSTSLTEDANRRSKNIRIVDISYPLNYCKNSVEILDTPGLNSTNEYHEKTTLNYLPNGNACIMLLNSTMPLSKSERHYFHLVGRYINKVFFVANKINLLDEDERKEFLEYVPYELQKELNTNNTIKVFPINAKLAVSGDFEKSEFKEFINELEHFLVSDEKAKEIIQPPVKNALNSIRLIEGNINTLVKGLKFSPEEYEKKVAANIPKLERIKRRREEILQFINDRESLLVNRLEMGLPKYFDNTLDEITNHILSWQGEVGELKGELPYYLKEILMELMNSLQSDLADEIDFVQNETIARFDDLLNDIADLQDSFIITNTEIEAKTLKPKTESIDGNITHLIGSLGGGFGLGYLSVLLLGPIGLIAAIGGSIFWSSWLAEKRRIKTLQEIANKIVPLFRKELEKTMPKVNKATRNSFEQFRNNVDERIITALDSVESTIERIKQERQLEESKIDAKIKEYQDLGSKLNNIENNLLEYSKLVC